jgi:hypothetical protein
MQSSVDFNPPDAGVYGRTGFLHESPACIVHAIEHPYAHAKKARYCSMTGGQSLPPVSPVTQLKIFFNCEEAFHELRRTPSVASID